MTILDKIGEEIKRVWQLLEDEVAWRQAGHRPRMTERNYAILEGRLYGLRFAEHLLIITPMMEMKDL